MIRTITRSALIAMAAVAVAAPTSADEWKIDSSHSGAHFGVRHMMVSTVRGDFSGVKGTVVYDGGDVKSAKVEATIDVSTISTREPKRDEHLKSADFFDVEKFPTMTFKSKRAAPAGEGTFKLVGDLTIKGITKEVVLDVDGPTAPVKNPWGMTVAGATATTKIKRSDFGITWNKLIETGGVVVGDDVTITIDIELVKTETEPAE